MKLEKVATQIVQKLQDHGHTAYFAGGWVRDYLLKHPSDDIDIATTASVEEVEKLFPKTIPVGAAFGILIVIEEGHAFEVATFRKERGYLDGRRPTSIEPASPKEDAKRRDFTINGMFYDPIAKQLFDYVDGQKDLKAGIIRAIGNPNDRFLEDRLRMMRAARYSTRFNFPIEKKTQEAILAHAKDLLPAVAMERVWQEFQKMSQFAHFDQGLLLLHKLKLLPVIFPSLKDVSLSEITKRIAPIQHYPKNAPAIAELLELFPNSSLEDNKKLCEYLKLSNNEKLFVNFYHHAHSLFDLPHSWQEKLEPFEWAQFYAVPSSALAVQIVAARYDEKQRTTFLAEHIQRKRLLAPAIERARNNQPILKAERLMQEGIKPGELLGKLIIEAERLAVDNNLTDPEEVLLLLKQNKLWPNS